jgi:hypothetical protein
MAVTLAPKIMFEAGSSALRTEQDAVHFLLFPVFNLSGLPYLHFWMVPLHKVIEADLALFLREVVDCSLNILKNSYHS